MDQREWKIACINKTADRTWDNECRKIQLSLEHNKNPKATVRHHLMNTPEQIAYNKEHYEMWGFNLDGTFEYGKYIIFVTEEEHREIHNHGIGHEVTYETRQKISNSLKSSEKHPWRGKKRSEETCKRISESNKQHYKEHPISDERKKQISESVKELWKDDEYKQSHIEYMKTRVGENAIHYGKLHSDSTKELMSKAKIGPNNPNYGKHFSEDHRRKICESNKGKKRSEETCKRISESKKGVFAGSNNPFYGKTHDDETLLRLSEATKRRLTKERVAYEKYRSSGGTVKWPAFRKYYKDHIEEFSISNGDNNESSK